METQKFDLSSITIINQVLTTTDYSRFSFIEDNRDIDPTSLTKLRESFDKNGSLYNAIIVNEKLQIIKGQTRFTALKERGLPIKYIIEPNYGLEEIKILSTNSKSWNKYDYLDSFCELNIKPYIQFRKFMKDTGFSMNTSERILCTVNQRNQYFQQGDLHIPNIKAGYEIAKKLKDFKPYFAHYDTVSFVSAAIRVFRHPDYVHSQMMEKVKAHRSLLKKHASADSYVIMLEDIFNYYRKVKVPFKYNNH